MIKYEHIYPNIESDAFWELNSNVEKRIEWDSERWNKGKVIEKKDNSIIINWTSPKPPIPMINARDMLVEFFVVPNGAGEGRNVIVGKSVDHASCPPPKGWGSNERGNVRMFGSIIEKNPNGAGSKITHMRNIDMVGKFPEVAVKKGNENI